MNKLNRYLQNQKEHIAKLMNQPLIGFTNQQGEQASWNDGAVCFTSTEGKKVYFYLTNATVKQNDFRTPLTNDQILSDELRHLLIVYAIDLCASKVSISTKRQKHFYARQVINNLGENPATLASSDLSSLFDEPHAHVIEFFQWLQKNSFISATLKLPKRTKQSFRSGDALIEHKKNSLPEEKVLLALGAIFHDVISPDESKWNVHPTAPQRDAFVCGMSALGMASPNRIAAEQTVLVKQKLKSHTQIVNGKKELVHYLDWSGSKGYKNYQNHLLSVMSDKLNSTLKYMNKVCEPGRILAKFYENPNMPLKTLLGKDFRPAKHNMKLLSPDMNKPINLIHLGFLLGFYDHGDGMVRVTKTTKGAIRNSEGHGYCKYLKPIVELQPEDEFQFSRGCNYGSYLIGTFLSSEIISKVFSRNTVTVEQFQKSVMQYIVSQLGGFPMGFNGSNKGSCKYKYALFCFLGSQLFTKANPPYMMGKSHYALVPLQTLGNIFAHELSSKENTIETKSCTNIFMRHGFSLDFWLRPHQLRHWLNDVAEREGVSHALINLWSGRKTPEQILHYIYRTHDEKAAEISDIMFSESGKEVTVKVISQQEYEKLAGIVATETSTGFCTQNLSFSPCEYLNDFVTQCSLCPFACYAAHDNDAITLLKKDLAVQECRLDDVQKRPNFGVSQAMQEWYIVHHRNTSMLGELIKIMERDDIKKGSIIRLLSHKGEYRITDLEAKKVIVNEKLSLPNSTNALMKALESSSVDQNSDSVLDDLLALL
ncbi:TPA: hypothetical protein KD839_004054 [Vibrio parahaemolyticus]|nr:hypothetical protein [Vibrio parahaemolyticus]